MQTYESPALGYACGLGYALLAGFTLREMQALSFMRPRHACMNTLALAEADAQRAKRRRERARNESDHVAPPWVRRKTKRAR